MLTGRRGGAGPGPARHRSAVPVVAAGPGGWAQARMLFGVAAGLAVVAGMLTCLYGWTVTSLRPHGLPVLAAGPAGPARALADQLSSTEPGALKVRVVSDGDAADRALRAREAYAAFVIGAGGMSLHVASAASPAVAEAMQHGVAQVIPDADIPVVDVVPNAPADQVGGALSAGYLPLVLVLALGGVVLARSSPRRGARLAGLAGLAAASGASGAASLHFGLRVLPGSYLPAAGVLALLAVAVAGTVLGLGARAGRLGLAGGFGFFVVSAAMSAWSSAPELLPPPWGMLGQLAPPGAGVSLLRSAAYFHGAGGGDAVAVLTVWAALGVALVMVGDTGACLGGARAGGAAVTQPAGFPGIPLPPAPQRAYREPGAPDGWTAPLGGAREPAELPGGPSPGR